jgi:hypothetical protein
MDHPPRRRERPRPVDFEPTSTRDPTDDARSLESARVHRKVVAALLLGVLGILCLPVVGGLGAIAMGFAARSDLERSPGSRRNLRLASAAIALGAAGVLLSFAGLALLVGALTRPQEPPHHARLLGSGSGTGTAPPSRGATARLSATASEDRDNMTTSVGSVVLVEIGPEVASLQAELTRQRAMALEQGQALLVWLTVPDCPPCNGVAAALTDTRLRSALGRARLVRVDATIFAAELAELGLPLDVFPGFALLGTNNRPVDYLNGGEWDEDLPSRIAPVLGPFLRGRLERRRRPWRGEARDDETPI